MSKSREATLAHPAFGDAVSRTLDAVGPIEMRSSTRAPQLAQSIIERMADLGRYSKDLTQPRPIGNGVMVETLYGGAHGKFMVLGSSVIIEMNPPAPGMSTESSVWLKIDGETRIARVGANFSQGEPITQVNEEGRTVVLENLSPQNGGDTAQILETLLHALNQKAQEFDTLNSPSKNERK